MDRTPARLLAHYRSMRDGTAPVVALAPSDGSAARPWLDRAGACAAGPVTGTVWCARCADRGHATLAHVRTLETCHDDGWKAATVAAVEAVDGPRAARQAQAWLSRWSPREVLTIGCRVCNAEDADHTGDDRRCGIDCC